MGCNSKRLRVCKCKCILILTGSALADLLCSDLQLKLAVMFFALYTHHHHDSKSVMNILTMSQSLSSMILSWFGNIVELISSDEFSVEAPD